MNHRSNVIAVAGLISVAISPAAALLAAEYRRSQPAKLYCWEPRRVQR